MNKKFVILTLLLVLTFSVICGNINLKDCVFATDDDFGIVSSSAYVCDYYTGKVIYEKNADERKPIASMTKVVGLGILFDEINKGNILLTDEVVVSETAADVGGSSAFLDSGASYKVEDLIKSVVIASANDSMVALAEHVSGNEKGFVAKMNDYAKSIGMKNTLFENATGLPSLNAYSTAKDITLAFKRIVDNAIFQKYCKVWIDELMHPSGRKTELVNTNRLIKTYDNMIGGKTGYTNTAKYCFVGSARKGDMKIIASILGAEDSKVRFNEVKEMFNYAFANYSNKLIISSNIPVCKIHVKNAKLQHLDVYSSENLYNFQKNSEKFNVQVVTKLNDIKAPISAFGVVGKVYLIDENGLVVAESNLIIKESAEKVSFKDCLDKIIVNW